MKTIKIIIAIIVLILLYNFKHVEFMKTMALYLATICSAIFVYLLATILYPRDKNTKE